VVWRLDVGSRKYCRPDAGMDRADWTKAGFRCRLGKPFTRLHRGHRSPSWRMGHCNAGGWTAGDQRLAYCRVGKACEKGEPRRSGTRNPSQARGNRVVDAAIFQGTDRFRGCHGKRRFCIHQWSCRHGNDSGGNRRRVWAMDANVAFRPSIQSIWHRRNPPQLRRGFSLR
jgi:hypothetical protein